MIQLLLNQLLVLLTLGLFSGLFQLSNFHLLEVQYMKLSYQTKVYQVQRFFHITA